MKTLVKLVLFLFIIFIISCFDEKEDAETYRYRVFVTSAAYDGDFGGLSGADEICNLAANAAGLGGTWIAWLSDSHINAIDRIEDVGPWYLVNGTSIVVNNKDNLKTTPIIAIAMDENGATVDQSTLVWTATLVGGIKQVPAEWWSQCQDWTVSFSNQYGLVGKAWSNSNSWTQAYEIGAQAAYSSCNKSNHLYCFEQ